MAFRVGQRVVCVDAERTARWSRQWLVEGTIYTIKSFAECLVTGGPGVHLEEVTRDNIYAPFGLWRFRPLVDISDLQAICTEVKNGKPRKITEVNPLDHTRVKVKP